MMQTRWQGLLAASLLAGTLAGQGLPDRVNFDRHIRPILSSSCLQCHGPDDHARKAGRRLDTRAGALAARKGVRAVVPGDPDASALLQRVSSHDPKRVMPPKKSKKPALTARQVGLLRRWIEQGATYERHWSLRAPTSPAVPKNAAGRSPIDRFLGRKLARRGLKFAPAADRRTLIRRVTFDLTGLPPTPAEVDAFVADSRPDAYGRLVDRLLASPRYGERMAVAWLDAARYADTSAHHADGPRDMWAWRDLVVDSFNQNMPYDRFTTLQLAGDLLPNASLEAKVHSAFNRNHCTSDEGGAFPEELRVGYVVDRVRTTSMVWLGLTMECAQCHSHKYDPITQREYYKFFAFFNQTKDPGMQTRRGNQKPIAPVLDKTKLARIPAVKRRLAALDGKIQARERAANPAFLTWLESQRSRPIDPPQDMTAYFPLDQSFANAVARKGGKSVAKATGTPKFQKGRIKQAVRVDNKNYVDVGDAGDFERTDRFSFGCWVLPQGKPNGAAIARMEDRNGHRGWDLLFSSGRVSMHLIHRWPEDALKVTTDKALAAKKWQHVFVTYDGSSRASGVKIYVDGVAWPHKPERDSLRSTTRNKIPLRIGRRTPGSVFRGSVDDVRIYRRTLTQTEVALLAQQDPIGDLLRTPKAKRTEPILAPARAVYLGRHDAEWGALRAARDKVRGELQALEKPITTVMVMQEMAKPRPTFVLHRGEYDQPTEDLVAPGVPACLPPMRGLPRNRLGLAKWLTDPRHPLTARVTVNRFWFQVFGRGIVTTLEDFGAQGAYPTHPDLLDWLATDFVGNGWNVKRLMRQLVTSRAYRQSSRVASAADPENELYSRGPRLRLDAEFIRDTALSVSGLLVDRMGGPAVKPYQPPGLWNEVSLNKGVRFRQDKGDKLYRRSLYTYWKRSAPPPSMRIFDAPTRERCVLRRPRTNTPLQALVTLNDPQFLEAARCLAERMMRAGDTLAERITLAYRLVLSRRPQPEELEVFRATLRPTLADYRRDPAKAKIFLAVGDKPRDEGLDAAEHAAWTVLASMILNLDEAVTK